MSISFIDGNGCKVQSGKASNGFSHTFPAGSTVTLVSLKGVCRKVFGKWPSHAAGSFTVVPGGAVAAAPSSSSSSSAIATAPERAATQADLRDGVTLRCTYRLALGCPQPMSVLLGGKRGRSFGGRFGGRGLGALFF